MAGTFSSINTALTALRYQQVSLDIASTNVANVGTDGYVRRRVVGETLGAAGGPALWARSNETASGVQTSRTDRMTDALLDVRVRREHGRQTYLDTKSKALARVETGLAEPGTNGVANALTVFRKTLNDAGNAPGSDASRAQVLSAANTLVDAIRLQSTHVNDEVSDQQAHLDAALTEVNTVASNLAETNRTIAAAKAGGNDTTTLMDVRDALSLKLAELTGAKSTELDDGTMEVTLNGQPMVSGFTAATLTQTGSPVTFELDPDISGGTTAIAGALGGDIGATAELLNVDLPAYLGNLATVAQNLADSVNTQHALGYDASGIAGGDFFDYDPADVLGTLSVKITNPSELALSEVPGGGKDGNNGGALATSVNVDDSYQKLVNGFGSQVQSAQRLADNQQALTSQVDNAREQLAGVSIDEETVNMVAAQRAYQAAARVMSTIDEVLDTLINRMAV
jgi:flagellar hook-associated protein 1 FlgK